MAVAVAEAIGIHPRVAVVTDLAPVADVARVAAGAVVAAAKPRRVKAPPGVLVLAVVVHAAVEPARLRLRRRV